MKVNPLLRFLNKKDGPIVRLSTRQYDTRKGNLFYSVAELHDDVLGKEKISGALSLSGGGWSLSRQESQEKSIIEAIERWAFLKYSAERPGAVGIQLDASTNGFAAMPAELGASASIQNSIYESFERYMMSQFWDYQGIPLREILIEEENSFIYDLISNDKGVVKVYGCEYEKFNESYPSIFQKKETAFFVLALFFRSNTGVVSGAACGGSFQKTQERALLEMYNHLSALEFIESKGISSKGSILDERLINFGTTQELTFKVKSAVHRSLESASLNKYSDLKMPKIVFSSLIHGPWNPDVFVSRVILEGSLSISEGDNRRFLI